MDEIERKTIDYCMPELVDQLDVDNVLLYLKTHSLVHDEDVQLVKEPTTKEGKRMNLMEVLKDKDDGFHSLVKALSAIKQNSIADRLEYIRQGNYCSNEQRARINEKEMRNKLLKFLIKETEPITSSWFDHLQQTALSEALDPLDVIDVDNDRRLGETNGYDYLKSDLPCRKIVIIEGDPGSGKTTYVSKLIHDWLAIQKNFPPDWWTSLKKYLPWSFGSPPLPSAASALNFDYVFFVALQFLQRNNNKSCLIEYFKATMAVSCPNEDLWCLLSSSRSLLILDGYDEKPCPYLLEEIKSIIPNIIVTTRAAHYSRVRDILSPTIRLKVKRFIMENRKTFFKKQLANEETINKVQNIHNSLPAFAQVPLYASILCSNSLQSRLDEFANNGHSDGFLIKLIKGFVIEAIKSICAKKFQSFNQDKFENGMKQAGKIALTQLCKRNSSIKGICSRIVGFDNVEESLVDASIAFEFEFIFRKFLYDKPNHEHVYEIDFVHNVFREYFAGEYLLTLLNDLNAAELNQLPSKMETFPEIFSATLMESDDVFSSMILKASKIVYCDRNLDDFADRLPERNKADICFQNWNWNLLPSFVVQSFKYMTEVTFANCIFPSFTIDKSAELNISTLRLVDTQLTVDEFAELISIKSLRLLIVRKCDIRWVKSERLTTCEPNFNSFVYQAPNFASLPADLLVTCIHQKLKMFWLEMPNESETQILSRAIKIDGLHMCITDSTYESDENTMAKRSPKIIISLKHRQVAESIYRRLCEMVKSNELRIKNTADVLIASPAQLQHKWYIFAKKHLLSNANSNSGTDS